MNTNVRTQILRYLAQGKPLTPLKALEKFNCLSLSQRVGELKKLRWPIESRMVKLPNGKRVASYRLDTRKRVNG